MLPVVALSNPSALDNYTLPGCLDDLLGARGFRFRTPTSLFHQPTCGRARSLQEQYREREALDLYLQALKVDPDHFEAVCAASYLYGQVGKRFLDKKSQREY